MILIWRDLLQSCLQDAERGYQIAAAATETYLIMPLVRFVLTTLWKGLCVIVGWAKAAIVAICWDLLRFANHMIGSVLVHLGCAVVVPLLWVHQRALLQVWKATYKVW